MSRNLRKSSYEALLSGAREASPSTLYDTAGYAPHWEQNLLAGLPISEITADLSAAAGCELDGKLRAAHSSAALAVNIGNTPLIRGAMVKPMVREHQADGADPAAVAKNGDTALKVAQQYNCADCAARIAASLKQRAGEAPGTGALACTWWVWVAGITSGFHHIDVPDNRFAGLINGCNRCAKGVEMLISGRLHLVTGGKGAY